jgi:hypothetical protein
MRDTQAPNSGRARTRPKTTFATIFIRSFITPLRSLRVYQHAQGIGTNFRVTPLPMSQKFGFHHCGFWYYSPFSKRG